MKNTLHLFCALFKLTQVFAQSPDSTLHELPDQRTYFSKTYYNERDNTYIARISPTYVHYLAGDGAFKDIDTNLRLDKSGAYYIIDSGLYNVAFAAVIGQGNWDVAYEVPRSVQPKFFDPSQRPEITRIRWKVLSYGYFDRQRSTYQIIQSSNSVTPAVSGNVINYPQIFNGIDVRYSCGNVSVKEEIVLSQFARNNLPGPAQYGLSRTNSYFVVAIEFLLTPNNINVFARRQGNKLPIKQGNDFVFDGDEAIEFEDEHTTLHFFFPKDYAHAAGDSIAGFSNRTSLRRYFYSQAGKNYMLVGVPYNWIAGAPTGDLIIDPTTSVGASDDVWLEDGSAGLGSSTQFLIGKAASYPKKRTLIKFNTSSVPTNAMVLNAQMKLYYYTAVRVGSTAWVDRWVQAHQILVNWNELQATDDYRLTSTLWNVNYVGLNDIDAKSGYESTTLFQQDYPKWKQWDITALTQKWVNFTATNYGVVLWATNETTDGYDLRFYSSEYTTDPTLQPKLEIIYSTDAATKTVYFLKDPLGSIRATVLDSATAPVIGYDDYDPWGYPLASRTKATPYTSLQAVAKNKFTEKEWDDDYSLNWYHFPGRSYDPQIGRWLARDPKAENSPNLTPYHYTRNNPLIYIDPTGEEEFKVTVRSYIPFQRVGPFLGDARGPLAETDRFRTEQIVRVETDPNISANPLLSKQAETGTTIALLPFSPYVLTGKSEGEFSASAMRTEVNQGNNVTLSVEGSAGNPLVPLPDALKSIDYQFQISIVPGKDGKFEVSIIGSHDAFPAYEIYITPAGAQTTQVYQFNPKSGRFEFLELRSPNDDVKVEESRNE